MLASLITVLVIQAVSLLFLFLIVQVYRSQVEKYHLLFTHMGNQEAWGNPGRYLLFTYIVLTFGVTVATTFFFLFQPHIL